MRKNILNKCISASLFFVTLVALSGCASAPRKKEAGIFFPPPPELPRIQYLTSYGGLKDIEVQSSFNKFVVGENQDHILDKPYGAAIFDGKIYACDTSSTVYIFDLKKKEFGILEAAATGGGKLLQPLNISIEPDGTKYITDPLRGQIVVFDRNDQYVKAYGTTDSWRPVDAVPYGDRLYVADLANGIVRVFDKASGEMLKKIGDQGDPSQRLDRPTNLAFDPDGYLYVTDFGRFQIVKFDRDGHFKSTVGQPGDSWGQFTRPKGIAITREGYLYVPDAAFNNIQVFNKDGRLLLYFGGTGKDPGQFVLPAKVVIDYDNIQYFQDFADKDFQIEHLVIVTSQLESRSVSVLAYGRQKGKKYPTEQELLRIIDERRKKEAEKKPGS